jgi:hypothetical protein
LPSTKTVSGPSRGGTDEREGKETSGSENKTYGEFGKGWQSLKVSWALIPRRIKIGSHCKAKEWTN